MKIGILTLPLHTNYGGILQAWALQTVLERMGHEVKVIDKVYIKEEPSYLVYICRMIKKVLGHKDIHVFSERDNNRYEEYTRKNTSVFISKHIHRRLVNCLKELKHDEFDAIVVGSDQVWRPYYFKGNYNVEMSNAFLSFAEDWNIKRVAYAASFGVDEWEFTEEETGNIKTFIQLFDAISVREMSGVDLCKSHFNVVAKHVLDPTMLLDGDDYMSLFTDNCNPPKGTLLCYILDQDESKQCKVAEVARILHLTPFSTKADNYKDIQPPVEDWLHAFHYAEFVVTDSFHACVFCILNHKPFIAISNEVRGKGRFLSLLATFGLQDRLIDSTTFDISKLINTPIDYAKVDSILSEKREESMNYLKQYLP